tara:strand:- start:135 stop:563 length:429 start_codon:yes stop_codon:yes gene_type:complete
MRRHAHPRKLLTPTLAVCAVDSYEFTALAESIAVRDVEPSVAGAEDPRSDQTLMMPYEHKPHFHEWATALPGMICVSRKARNSTFRNYVAAETATPVISCCACLGADDQKNFYFAGELQYYYRLLNCNLVQCNTALTSICIL